MARAPLFGHVLARPQQETHSVRFVDATAALDTGHDVIVANSTVGNVTLTLPPARLRGTRIIVVKAVAANQVIVQCAGTDLIAAAPSVTLNAFGAVLFLIASGAGVWLRII